MLELQAGPPGCSTPPRLQEPSCTTVGPCPPSTQQFLNLHPLKGEGGIVPAGWLKQLAAVLQASPALLTGRRSGYSWGQRVPWLMTHTLRMGLSRWQVVNRTGGCAGSDPGPDHRQVTLTALLSKWLHSIRGKKGQDQTLPPLTG